MTRGRDQDHPQQKEMQKEMKWLSEEEAVKSKGEKEIYTHLNAEEE